MKYLLLLLSILLHFSGSAQLLKQGDNLHTAFAAISKAYYLKVPPFTDWIEGSDMIIISDKPKAIESKYLFLTLKDTSLLGIYSTTAPVSYLLDTSGNGILGAPVQYFVLPEWIVKRKTKIDPSDKKLAELFDKLYEKTLQANDLELDEETMNEYKRYKTDTTLANRHIALLFDSYQTLITSAASRGENPPPEQCLPLAKQLSEECLSLYKTIPVIVCIYLGEALMSANMEDRARAHFKTSLLAYPKSIPLMVYNYKLEQDPTKQKQMLTRLKLKYPNHWMVMDL